MSARLADFGVLSKTTESSGEHTPHVNLDTVALGALPCITPGASQKVSFDGSVASAAIASAEAKAVIRVAATKACWLAFGASPTAVADGTCMYLPADAPEYFRITSGHKVAAIKVAEAGDLLITVAA